MNEENRPIIDCLCPCGENYKVNSKFLLTQIEIRKDDLVPYLEQIGIFLNFPVYFIPDTIYTEDRKKNNTHCLLDFHFSYQWLFIDNEKKIRITSSECGESRDDQSSPWCFFPKMMEALGKSHYNPNEELFNRIEENDHYAVSYPVELADTKIGVLGLGPFKNQSKSFLANWDNIKKGIDKALKNSAEHLQEVLWRRIGDCLTEQGFIFHKEIAKAYHDDGINSLEKVENVTQVLIDGLTALIRQCFIMEGVMVFRWQPKESAFCLFTEAGPGCEDISWRIHEISPGKSSQSLVATADETKNIVIWQDNDEISHIHENARKAYNKKHWKHKLNLGFALPILMEEPAMGLTIVCYNPVGLDGKGIDDEENLNIFTDDYKNKIIKETPPPIGRNRFEWLVINELKRLFIAISRERRGWYFRELVTQGSKVTSFADLKKEFEGMLTTQVNAISVCVTKINSSEKDPRLEINQPILRASNDKPTEEWFLRTELSSATGNAQYYCDITWDNLLKKLEGDIRITHNRLMSFLVIGGTLLSARERMASWEEPIEYFYTAFSCIKVGMNWSEVLTFAEIISQNINRLTGSSSPCMFYKIEDWANHLWDETGKAVRGGKYYRFLKIFPTPESQNNAEYLDKSSTDHILSLSSGLDIAKSGWQDIKNIPGIVADKALVIILLGQPRGLLLISSLGGIFEENRYLVELFAHLLSHSLYLLMLRTEIEHAQFIRKELQKDQNASPTNLIAIFLSLIIGEKDLWPGFIWAQGILRVPWNEDPLLTMKYAFPSKTVNLLKEVKYVSEEWLEKLQIAGSVEEYSKDDRRYRAVKIYNLPAEDIKELPMANIQETPLIIIPLFTTGVIRGWIIGKLPYDVQFAVIRLAESMAREAAQFLHQSQKETEEMFSRSLFVHGIRNNAHYMGFMLKRLFRIRDEVKDMFGARFPDWGKDLDLLDDVGRIISDLIRNAKHQDYFYKLIRPRSSDESPLKNISKCNLVNIVEKQVEILRAYSEKVKQVWIKVVNKKNAQTMSIQGDERQLEIIVENLLDNAIKYSFRHSQIEVIMEDSFNDQGTSWWSLEVISKGKPFPPNVKALREPGTRKYKDPQRKNIPGRGLGLTLIHMICDQISADLNLWSESKKRSNRSIESDTDWYLNHVKIKFQKADQGDQHG